MFSTIGHVHPKITALACLLFMLLTPVSLVSVEIGNVMRDGFGVSAATAQYAWLAVFIGFGLLAAYNWSRVRDYRHAQ